MSHGYQELNLDELGFLGRGKSKHRPRNDSTLYGGDYPFIQTGSVKAASLHIKEYTETYNEAGLAQSKLWDKGTLLITIAANIAETAILDIKACFPDSIVGFIPDESKVNSYFIKYYIDYIKREMQSISQGTTQDNLSLDKIRTFKLKIPEKKIVDDITNVLLSYDNLIENNNRRIAILEDMAQSLYKEWFVKFRFPGHQNTKFKDSSLGLIPEGWEVVNLNDISVNFDRMRKPLSKIQRAKRQGAYPYYGAAKIFDYIDDYIFDGLYLLLAEDGSVITPDRKPVLQLVNDKFWPNNHTHILQASNGFNTEFLNVALSKVDVSPFVTGAAQPKINQTNMNRIQLLTADDETQKIANEFFREIYKQYFILIKKNKNLKGQRDLLLPKLISGKIGI